MAYERLKPTYKFSSVIDTGGSIVNSKEIHRTAYVTVMRDTTRQATYVKRNTEARSCNRC